MTKANLSDILCRGRNFKLARIFRKMSNSNPLTF